MITEETVMTIFVEANPAPDVDELDLVQTGSAAYLATLAQRSSEMTQVDTRREDQKEKRTYWPWLAAAMVIVLVGLAVVLLNQGDDAPVADQPFGPVTSFEDIAGTTYERQGGLPMYLLFLVDGTMHSSANPDLVVDRPSDVYTTRFDGTQVFITTPTSTRCPQPDQGGTYEIHLLESGSVQFVAIDEDACAQRSSVLQALDRDGVSAGGFVPVP